MALIIALALLGISEMVGMPFPLDALLSPSGEGLGVRGPGDAIIYV